MITVVTLNPCIDKTIEIETFLHGGTNIVRKIRNDISGKGINVNIVLQHLGVENGAVGFNYKEDRGRFLGFLDELGCAHSFVDVEGSLRTNIKIFEQDSSIMSEYNERGGVVREKDIKNFMEILEYELDCSAILVVNGSVPPGVSSDIYERIIEMGNKKNVKMIMDASGELLKNGIRANPYLIKPNQSELSLTYNKELNTLDDIVELGKRVVAEGVSYVCVSRGSEGAVFITKSDVYIAAPLSLEVKGVQGAGDSMVAGFCYALEQGLSDEAIFRHGVACASGSLKHPGTQLCSKEDMEELLPQIQIGKYEKEN